MRKMMKKIGIMVILGVFMFTGTLFAKEAKKQQMKNYGAIKVGYLMADGSSDVFGDLDNAFNFGASYGRFFGERFALEIGIEKYSLESSNSMPAVLSLVGGGTVNGTVEYSGEIGVWAIPVTAKFHIPIGNNINTFLGGGVGYYMVDADYDRTARAPGFADTPLTGLSESSGCFGYHAVAGADFTITQHMSLGAEVKWSKAEQGVKLINGEEEDMDIGGINFNVVAKFLF